jgi:hypothetical protein
MEDQTAQPEKTPQLPVSPQETQIQAPSFKERISAQKKKILIGLGSLLGVLILAGAVFGVYKYAQRQIPIEPAEEPTPTLIATPTPNPTTDWQTYTSEQMGFSIKYPSGWFTHKAYGTLSRWEAIFSYPVDNPSTQDFKEGQKASIRITSWKPEDTLEEYGQETADLFGSSHKSYITVAGRQALVIEGMEEDQNFTTTFVEVLLDNDGERYSIHFFVSTTESKDLEPLRESFDLMLSTFRFD